MLQFVTVVTIMQCQPFAGHAMGCSLGSFLTVSSPIQNIRLLRCFSFVVSLSTGPWCMGALRRLKLLVSAQWPMIALVFDLLQIPSHFLWHMFLMCPLLKDSMTYF